MEGNVFRKKSIERISSPEQLNDYLRVCNIGVWLVMAAVILILAGAVVWSVFGRLDTTVDIVALSEDGKLTAYVKVENAEDILEIAGKKMTVSDTEFTVSEDMISPVPVTAGEELPDYALFAGELQRDQWVYKITLESDMAQGIYKGMIVTDSVKPVSFVFN